MKRRSFLAMFGLAATTIAVPTVVKASTPDNSDCLCPYERGEQYPVSQAVLDDCHQRGMKRVNLACLTNGKLFHMVARFDRDCHRTDRLLRRIADLRWIVERHPAYFRQLRYHFGLSFHKDWLEEHIRLWTV